MHASEENHNAMDWQEYIVAAIAIAVVGWIIGRLCRFVRGEGGGCGSCSETDCPRRRNKNER